MLSIVIVNYKGSKDIDICLQSIMACEKHYTTYEIIIVDNNSDDPGLPAIEKKYPFVKVLYAPENGGFAYGNNFGIKVAKGDCIFLLNPDTYIEDNSIEKLHERLMSHDDCDFIGPKVLYPDKRNQSYFTPKSYLTVWRLFCERFFLHRIFKRLKFCNSYFRTYMDYDRDTYVEQLAGSAFMFKRKVIDTIGLMDDSYFMYFEESDYCLQAVRNGYKLLYYPESIIYHVGGLISESNWVRSTRDYTVSFKHYFRKNFSFIHYYAANLLFFAGSFLRMLLNLCTFNKKYKYYFYYMKQICKRS